MILDKLDEATRNAHPTHSILISIADARKLIAVARAAQSMLSAADAEGLLLGAGRNHPAEKEGPLARALRDAIRGLGIGE